MTEEKQMTFDPTKQVKTRAGMKARIICADAKSNDPIIALVTSEIGKEIICTYGINGRRPSWVNEETEYDLINIEEPIDVMDIKTCIKCRYVCKDGEFLKAYAPFKNSDHKLFCVPICDKCYKEEFEEQKNKLWRGAALMEEELSVGIDHAKNFLKEMIEEPMTDLTCKNCGQNAVGHPEKCSMFTEEPKKLDLTKPIQTNCHRKAEVLCKNFKHGIKEQERFNVLVKVQKNLDQEIIYAIDDFGNANGYGLVEDCWPIENIPEPEENKSMIEENNICSTCKDYHNHCCNWIPDLSELNSAAREVLIKIVENGPIFDGDVPCKSGRDDLLSLGLCVKTIFKGEDGYNGATYMGYQVYKKLKEETLEPKQEKLDIKKTIDWDKPIEYVVDEKFKYRAEFIRSIKGYNNYNSVVLLYFDYEENIELSDDDGDLAQSAGYIQNIPSKPPLELVVGGVYKTLGDELCICVEISKEQDRFLIMPIKHGFSVTDYYTIDKEGKPEFGKIDFSLTEKLGDIRDLSPVIREALK